MVKGNAEWNYSDPRGAGHQLSRSQAKARISLESYPQVMRNVWTISVSKKIIDEVPKVYKSKKQLLEDIKETTMIQAIIKPLYNFKG